MKNTPLMTSINIGTHNYYTSLPIEVIVVLNSQIVFAQYNELQLEILMYTITFWVVLFD